MSDDILDTTDNMCYLYKHYTTGTEVPQQFYDWTFISAVMASVEDRVWVEKFPGKKMYLNQYIFLLGPSGAGKGTAFAKVAPFIEESGVRTHAGLITGAALTAMLATNKTHTDRGKIYLLHEELAQCIVGGEQAFEFIKNLTGIYAPPKTMHKATVNAGHVTLENICINWVAGSTIDWLVATLPKESIKGGFIGRVFPIYGEKNKALRIPRPKKPSDHDKVYEHLIMRFRHLKTTTGKMTLTPKARRIYDHWYMTRPEAESDELSSVWERQPDMVYKFGGGFSLCEDYSLKIRASHISTAIEAITHSMEVSKRLVKAANGNDDTSITDIVRVLLCRARMLPESSLMRACTMRGITKRAMLIALESLLTERVIRRDIKPMAAGGRMDWYTWQKGTVNNLRSIK